MTLSPQLRTRGFIMTANQTTRARTTDTNDLLGIVIDALAAKGRLPCPRPFLGLQNDLDSFDISGLYLEQHPGGWVANITFEGVPPGEPNTIGTPDAAPFPTKRKAFLAGAMLLCRVLTGSGKLPFFLTEDKLVVVGYGTGGFSGLFCLDRPLPWI